MTKSTSSSDDAFQDSLNFVKKLWGGMSVPGMGASGMSAMPSMTVPTMSVEELDKRIAELKSVESWLNMNVGMLHNTIQAMEIQRATLATLQSLSSTMSQTMQGSEVNENAPATPDMTPLFNQSAAWWSAVQEQFKQALGAAFEKSAAPVDTAKPAADNIKKPVRKRTTGAKSTLTSKARK